MKGKRVLITGASGDIGASMVKLFASQGAWIGIHYQQNRKKAEILRESCKRQGAQAECFRGDLLEHAGSIRLMERFLKRFRRIDVLINNAGAVIGPAHFTKLNESSWDQTLALNAKAPFFLARQAFLQMKRQNGGKIINISSVSAKYGGSPRTIHYGAAKAALDAITVGLARSGAPHRILVNSIRAGFIDTSFHRKIGRTQLQKRIHLIPLQRAGVPLDVARTALFLASEAGDFITGEVLTVSGGD